MAKKKTKAELTPEEELERLWAEDEAMPRVPRLPVPMEPGTSVEVTTVGIDGSSLSKIFYPANLAPDFHELAKHLWQAVCYQGNSRVIVQKTLISIDSTKVL